MNDRHKTPRHAPPGQRIPQGKGWNRAYLEDDAVTVWKLWRPAPGSRMLVATVEVSDLEIALAGRKRVADRLRKMRKELATREAEHEAA
jgi:hypothetical protein